MMILPKNEISIEKLEKRVDTIENLYRTMAKCLICNFFESVNDQQNYSCRNQN